MSTQSNALTDSRPDVRAGSPTSFTRPFYWSVRRELWEWRSIYIAPLAVAGFLLFAFLIATLGRALATQNLEQRRVILEEPYDFAALMIMGTMLVVAIFYCLDGLHGERRDRSILFWKSLPVSDTTAVLAKASIPVLVLPLVAFGVTVVTQMIMLLLSRAAMVVSGIHGPLWKTSMPSMWVTLFFHLFGIHGLWYAPFYAWLLLVSGWARRAAFLWAGLPLLAIGIIEKVAFQTAYFAHFLGRWMSGPNFAVMTGPGKMAGDAGMMMTASMFLRSPGLWGGLAVAAIFLAGAVGLRRYRGPI